MAKKGQMSTATIWISTILVIFIVGSVWIAFDGAWDKAYGILTPELSGESLTTAGKIQNVWKSWPLLFIVVGIIVAIIRMVQNRDTRIG